MCGTVAEERRLAHASSLRSMRFAVRPALAEVIRSCSGGLPMLIDRLRKAVAEEGYDFSLMNSDLIQEVCISLHTHNNNNGLWDLLVLYPTHGKSTVHESCMGVRACLSC